MTEAPYGDAVKGLLADGSLGPLVAAAAPSNVAGRPTSGRGWSPDQDRDNNVEYAYWPAGTRVKAGQQLPSPMSATFRTQPRRETGQMG